ncbi:MAG: hypothetical protein OXC02_04635 [Rhodobacteraceae bacterium]|nr:hypothetical protein [Paracoccaceae bacterium]
MPDIGVRTLMAMVLFPTLMPISALKWETAPVFRLGTTAERSDGQTTPKRQCVTPHSGASRHERRRRDAQPGQSQSRLRRQ